MDRIVLFYPDLFDVRRPGRLIDRQILPLSLTTVGTTLVRDGFHVDIIDQRVAPDWETRLRQGLAAKPLFLGVSSMTGIQIRGAIEASNIAQEVAPQVPVVWGGIHPSLLPDQTLAHPSVDIVCIGEGDETAPALARALRDGRPLDEVDGIAFQRGGRITRTKHRPLVDVNELPRVDYDVMGPLDPWLMTAVTGLASGDSTVTKRHSLAYQSSRGCAHPCAYCYNLVHNEMAFRARTPELVVDEIEAMVKSYDLAAIFLLDDNFFQSKRRVEHICEGLVERDLGIEIYNANCRIDYIATYSVEFLKLLKRAGIRELRIGIESGSDSMQQSIDKFTTAEECVVANRKLADAGIVPSYNFMTGFPGEDRTQIHETLALMSRLLEDNPQAHVDSCSLFSPYPGTPLYDVAIRSGWKPPERLEDWVKAEWKDLNTAPTPAWARYLCDIHEFSGYLDPKHHHGMALLYSRVANLRVRRNWIRFLPEVRLRRLLRTGMGFVRRTAQPFSYYREPVVLPMPAPAAA